MLFTETTMKTERITWNIDSLPYYLKGKNSFLLEDVLVIDPSTYHSAYHCREALLNYWKRNQDVMCFLVGRGEGRRVERFVGDIERKLKIPNKSAFTQVIINCSCMEYKYDYYGIKIKVTKIPVKNIYYILRIQVPNFWRISIYRRGLYSALLRTGVNYIPGTSIRQTCMKSKYFKHTYKAFLKFLNGKTKISFQMDAYNNWTGCMNKSKYIDQMF